MLNPSTPPIHLRGGLLVAVFLTFTIGLGSALAQKKRGTGDSRKSNDLVSQASRTYHGEGQKAKALALLEKAIQADPTNARAYKVRVKIYQEANDLAKVEADYTKIIALDPKDKDAPNHRGIARFFQGKIKEAIKDFDAYIVNRPRDAPHHWQRGIAQYYAGDFKGGRKQFEDHQKVNSNDVENAAWHYLCVAQLEGPAAARKVLIPISGDGRVPMSQIHDLFAGKGTIDDVLKAAAKPSAGSTPEERALVVKGQLSYAHLYLALYYEAHKKPIESLKHIKLAAGKYANQSYMGQVARIHHELRTKKK